ncbi:hypothetical protein [Hathewaya histolytica]|uniref:hypothetical protein n=1 Tax=Hathewaya histolytica TaxID=1498 RepID=UPI0039F09271
MFKESVTRLTSSLFLVVLIVCFASTMDIVEKNVANNINKIEKRMLNFLYNVFTSI